MDQRCSNSTTATKCARWVKKFVEFGLDISRVNGQTIFCLKKGLPVRTYNSFDFGEKLGMALILPFMSERYKYITKDYDSL